MPDDKTSEFFTKSLVKCGEMIKDGQLRVSDLDTIVLCTDGIEDPFFPIEENLEPIITQLTEGIQTPLPDFTYEESVLPLPPALTRAGSVEALEKWLSFQKRGENDDRTILVMYREPVLQTQAVPSSSHEP